MKINISRQHIYLMAASLFLFIFVLFFSFAILIPLGQEYRIKRLEVKKAQKELRQYENFQSETLSVLKELQSKERRVITAFDTPFNPQRFEQENKKYFKALFISDVSFAKAEDEFALYEVNTTSKIDSPTSFYNFLDTLNKSDWIIGVNFPIHFKREGEYIKSSFTMKVYCNNKDTNATNLASEAK